MKKFTIKKTMCAVAIVTAISVSPSFAGDDYPGAGFPKTTDHQRTDRSGTHMGNKGEKVVNPKNRRCNSVVDCRHKGQDVETINRFKGTDFSTKSAYPIPHQEKRRQARMNYWSTK